MENKFLAILVLVTFISCVDQYDIDSFSETQYEPYSNLGFEDGLEHWHGKANTFSNISIHSEAFEGTNSLKISINVDTSLQTENFEIPPPSGVLILVGMSVGLIPTCARGVKHPKSAPIHNS